MCSPRLFPLESNPGTPPLYPTISSDFTGTAGAPGVDPEDPGDPGLLLVPFEP